MTEAPHRDNNPTKHAASESDWHALAAAAKMVSAHAYVRYSGFRVGAAALTSHGTIARGCNVENASYGLTVCAERNAIFRAIGDGATEIVALALYTPTNAPVTPCGACRQVIAEFGKPRVRAYCDGADFVEYTMNDLLPNSFALDSRA
jgi:cytidine deaminase